MSALQSRSRRTETIKSPDGDFAVRGLALTDITELAHVHREALEKAVGQFRGRQIETLTASELGEAGFAFIESFPAMVAHVIALAEVRDPNEPPAFEQAAALPIGLQIEALEKIGKLTFEREGGPKKAIGTIVRVVQGALGLGNL